MALAVLAGLSAAPPTFSTKAVTKATSAGGQAVPGAAASAWSTIRGRKSLTRSSE